MLLRKYELLLKYKFNELINTVKYCLPRKFIISHENSIMKMMVNLFAKILVYHNRGSRDR